MTEAAATMEAVDPDMEPMTPPPAPTPPPASSWWVTPLFRDRGHSAVAGVLSGLAAAYGFDRRTTRIAYALVTLFVPALVLLYVAAWILLPEGRDRAVPLRDAVLDRRRLPLVVAVGVLVSLGSIGSIGSWFLLRGVPWGVALVALGVLLWLLPDRRSGRGAPSSPLATGTTAPPPAGWPAPTHGPTPSVAAPPTAPGAVLGIPPAPVAPRRRRWPIAPVALLVAVVVAGIAAIGDALDWWDARVLDVIVAGLIIVMIGLLAGAIVNRWWVGVPALLLLGWLTVSLAAIGPNLDGGVGERTVVPATADAAAGPHRLGTGRLEIDLTDVADDGEPTMEVTAELGIGELEVIVPADVSIELRAEVGAGRIAVDGNEIADGFRVDASREIGPIAELPLGGTERTIVLRLSVGLGAIDVVRSGS